MSPCEGGAGLHTLVRRCYCLRVQCKLFENVPVRLQCGLRAPQDVLTGKESVVEYTANELIVIPARVAHLFEYNRGLIHDRVVGL